ncbi:hypothetical protein [Streptomyces sp. NBC_01262]|uniref:hypothetical protein n=1 Tax=Streptomyces sp. NBC_01262 TaxID=2903803 RepID=UPI002E2FCC2A|nr:hypothetical protein [Streptomyces sp. NBC_01262]
MPARPPTSTRSATGTLAIVGMICALAGFFVLGIVLGPIAVFCGWLGMRRGGTSGRKPIPAVVALVLGAIDTLIALLWLTNAGW